MSGKFHRNKGGNWQSQRTIVSKDARTSPDGIVHRTGAECKRWCALLLLQQGGHIRNLRREVKYRLEMFVNLKGYEEEKIAITSMKGNVRTYTADFVYDTRNNDIPPECRGVIEDGWFEVIEDIKGFLEPVQELRLDIFAAFYGRRVFINKA